MLFDQSDRHRRAGELPPVLVLSVCAMSARFSTHPHFVKMDTIPCSRGEEWASVAREIVTRRYEWPSLTLLTCLLILALNEFATCQGERSWSLTGKALRMAIALQLHSDPDQDPSRPGEPLSFVDREIQRRTMWACFLMDRLSSSGIHRVMFLDEKAIKVPLPVKEHDFKYYDSPPLTQNLQGEVPGALVSGEAAKADAEANMGVAAYTVKAISLWGRAVRHLNQGGKADEKKLISDGDSTYVALVKESEELATSLPEPLVYSRDNLHLHQTEQTANQFLLLHIAIQQNLLFLSRMALSSTEEAADLPSLFISQAGKRAFAAADRISEIIGDADHVAISAPYVGYCVYLSAAVHISGAFSESPSIKKSSSHNLAVNISFLMKNRNLWGIYDFLLQDLRNQFGKHRPNDGTQPAAPVPPHTIFQYGDWVQSYPHGLSRSDFMSPAIYKEKEKGEDAVMEQKADLQTVEEFRKESSTKLSPHSRDGNGRGGSGSVKRRAYYRDSIASRSGSGQHAANDHHQLDTLTTKFSLADPMVHLNPQQFSNMTMGPQTSSAASFPAITAGHQPNFNQTALTPISPGGVGNSPYGPVLQHHPNHQAHSIFNPDVLALQNQLAQQNVMLTSPHPHSHSIMPTFSTGSIDPSMTAMDGPHNNPHHTVFGHGHDAVSAPWDMMAYSFDVGNVNGLSSGSLPNGMAPFSGMYSNVEGGVNGNSGA